MKRLLICVIIIVLVTISTGFGEEIDNNTKAIGDRLLEFTLESAERFQAILHDDDYLERQFPTAIWNSTAREIMQGTDYSEPIRALVSVWNDECHDFSYFYGKRGIDLSEDTLYALKTKLFSTPLNLLTGMGAEWYTLKQTLALDDVLMVEDFYGIACVILFYGPTNPILITAYGSASDDIVMSKTSVAYMEEAKYIISSYYELSMTYFGPENTVWKVDLPIQ